MGFDARVAQGPSCWRKCGEQIGGTIGDVGLLLLVPLSFNNTSDSPHRPNRPQHPLRFVGLPVYSRGVVSEHHNAITLVGPKIPQVGRNGEGLVGFLEPSSAFGDNPCHSLSGVDECQQA